MARVEGGGQEHYSGSHTLTAASNCVFTIISVPETGVSNGDSRDSSVVRAPDL